MKFLIHIPQLIFGGAEKVLVSFANELVGRGHEVEILETYEKGHLKPQFDGRVRFSAICSKEYSEKYYASLQSIREEKNFGKKLVKCAKLTFSKAVGYRRFAEKLAAKRFEGRHFDAAINYLETDSPEFILNCVSADKYMQWIHTDVGNHENPEEIDRIIPQIERTDSVICVSKSALESFIGRYPDLAEKTHVIYNFFDAEAIRRLGEEPFSFEGGGVKLLSVGRMTEPKKYLRFLDVLARLKNDGFDFQWHVLGTGIQYDEIKEKTERLGLGGCVFLDGVTDNPYKYMKNCDLFVLPSGWEGFPTVTVEAKALGCPILATDVSGIREQLEHGNTGWIVGNSEKEIYDGLKLLIENPEIREKLKCTDGMESILGNGEKYKAFIELCGGNCKAENPE